MMCRQYLTTLGFYFHHALGLAIHPVYMLRIMGVVKWFDAKKGYGFIQHPEDQSDIFVHYSQIESGGRFKTLSTGDTVQFELEQGNKGLLARRVVVLSKAADESQG